MRPQKYFCGYSDAFLYGADPNENDELLKKLQKRADPDSTRINISLNGTQWTSPAETGPKGDDYYPILDASQPSLVQGIDESLQLLRPVERVLATANHWGDRNKPDPFLTASILLESENLEFNHTELPIFQIPRVILDGANNIATALANEALSAESADLIKRGVRKSILAATTAALGTVFRPFRVTLEKLKLKADNPSLSKCRAAYQELLQWQKLTDKLQSKVKFGINTIIRDMPLILKNSELLKHQEINENTVWWSGYDAAAWRRLSLYQIEVNNKIRAKNKALKKEVKSLKKANEVFRRFTYNSGNAIDECGIPFSPPREDHNYFLPHPISFFLNQNDF